VEKAIDRRQHARLTFSKLLKVRLAGSPLRAQADACDLSARGMSFRTRTKLEVGEDVLIHITDVVEHTAIAARVRHVGWEGTRYVVGVEHGASSQ
jgi:hypothetical protein